MKNKNQMSQAMAEIKNVENGQLFNFKMKNRLLAERLKILKEISKYKQIPEIYSCTNTIDSALTKRYPIHTILEFRKDDDMGSLIGTGSIYYINSRKKWGVAYYIGSDSGNKKRTVKQFNTEDEARRFLDDLVKEQCKNTKVVDTERPYYDDEDLIINACKSYVEIYKKGNVVPKTYGWYKGSFKHIEPYFDGKYLQELDYLTLKNFFLQLKGSESLLNSIYIVLKNTCQLALKKEIITRNLFEDLSKKKILNLANTTPQQNKEKYLQPDTIEKIYYAFLDIPNLNPLIQTLIYTGLRIGEVLALRWQDIDFNGNMIHVKYSLTSVVDEDKENDFIGTNKVVSKKPKTDGSVRLEPLHPSLADTLKHWMGYINNSEVYKKKRINNNANHLIFTNVDGNPHRQDTLRKRFNRILKKNNIYLVNSDGKKHTLTFHMFRHTFASQLAEKKVPISTLSELLGHNNLKTTMLYITVNNRTKTDAVLKIPNIGEK